MSFRVAIGSRSSLRRSSLSRIWGQRRIGGRVAENSGWTKSRYGPDWSFCPARFAAGRHFMGWKVGNGWSWGGSFANDGREGGPRCGGTDGGETPIVSEGILAWRSMKIDNEMHGMRD